MIERAPCFMLGSAASKGAALRAVSAPGRGAPRRVCRLVFLVEQSTAPRHPEKQRDSREGNRADKAKEETSESRISAVSTSAH